MTEAEKKHSKGGFLHLFDWNGKSRKKLFANNQELDGEAKKGKENVGSMAKSLLQVIEVDESRASPSNKGNSEFNCASSVTSDEGYGSRAPGVVARLMGLDCLPMSNIPKPCSTPYSDLGSLGTSCHDRSIPNLCSENHPVHYLNIPSKEWFCRNQVESRAVHKVQNRPIERYQTEMLPPKSAKSIPITHHKLLSPIKSHGFVPTRNTAYIVEAAAKIIEASTQANTKGKRPSIVSSVPLRIWDMKEKMEATHRVSRPLKANESVADKYMKGQHGDQSHRESDSIPAKASVNLEKRSLDNTRKKGKSISMAVQAKDNNQRREEFSLGSSSKSSMNHKKKNGVKANQFCKSQPDTQRTSQKGTSPNRTNNVLKQNNQKQNYTLNKDSSILRTSVLNQQVRKSKSTSGSVGLQRTVNRAVANSETGSRKTGLKMNTGKELSSSKVKNLSRKKQSANGDCPSEETIPHNEMKKDEKSIKCNIAFEGCMNWGSADNRKNGMDVVSFTFSSPIRSRPDPESSGQDMGKNNRLNVDYFNDDNQLYSKNSTFSSPGLNIIGGGDALSVLLEQKLMELTCKIESSHCNVIREGTSGIAASGLQDSMPTLSMVTAEEGQRLQVCLENNNSDCQDNSCSTSNDCSAFSINLQWQFQQSEVKERHSSGSNNNENGREFDHQHSSSVSSLEHSYTNVNCSDYRDSASDSKQFLWVQDQAESSLLATHASVSVDCGTELSDSASSILVGKTGIKHMTRSFGLVNVNESNNWEFDYLRELLDNSDLTMNEFALGQTCKVITLNLFNQLENHENKMGRNMDENSKLGRKFLFDFVHEGLDLKCQQFFVRSCKGWAKLAMVFQRKGWLAEELYKEVHCWKSVGDLMVDQLVDKDMSSQRGKWLDFDIEAFEEGVEIESKILTSLVDELVFDFLLC